MADFITSLHRAPGETAQEWVGRLQKIDPIPLAPHEEDYLQAYIKLVKAAVRFEERDEQIRNPKDGAKPMETPEEAGRKLEVMPHVFGPEKMKAIEDAWRKRAEAGDEEAVKFLKSLEKDKKPKAD